MGYKKYNKIFQYTKDGRLIKVWNGRKELLTSSFRMKVVYDCINGVNKSGDGFVWTTLFNRVIRSIDVEFDGEVGERTGSWKGGTIGCEYELRPNETPYECLKRMEQERKF